MLERVPPRLREAYLVLAFFVVPTVGLVLSAGQRPPPEPARTILWLVIGHHGLFLVASLVDNWLERDGRAG